MSGARAGYARLEDPIDWYDSKASATGSGTGACKVVSIASAALVPLLSSLDQKTAGSAHSGDD